MAYLLRFTGGTAASLAGYITHPAVLSGASTFDIEIDFTPRIIYAGYYNVYSNNQAVDTNRHAMYMWGSSRAEIAFIIGGTRRVLNSPVGTFTAGTRYKVNAVYNGATLQMLVNGVSVASVAATGTVGGASGLTHIGANTTEARAAIDLYSYKITENGVLVRDYDPSESGGTGTILPDIINSANNGTQSGTWPSDDSEWVFYSSGAITATISAGIPIPLASASITATTPTFTAEISAGLPVPIAAASITVSGAAITAAINAGLPIPSAAASITVEAPVFSASISGGLPIPTASASLINAGTANTASVSAGLPTPAASVSISVSAPVFSAAVAGGLPVPAASAQLTIGGINTIQVSAGLPIPAASVQAVSILPIYQATVAAGIPIPTATAYVINGVRVITIDDDCVAALISESRFVALPNESRFVAL